jgi:hypothetical protein
LNRGAYIETVNIRRIKPFREWSWIVEANAIYGVTTPDHY